MSLTYSDAVANARLNAVEATIGTSAIMKIRSGSAPATVATSSTGTVLATLNLPSDWMSNAASRSKALLGTWDDSSADASGTAGHFEITASDGTTVGMRGSVTATGGGGDLTLSSTTITSGQDVSVTSFTLTAGN